jgi:hypothetical protein
MKKKALLVGKKVGNRVDKSIVAEAIPFEDSLKCHTISVVMTGACPACVCGYGCGGRLGRGGGGGGGGVGSSSIRLKTSLIDWNQHSRATAALTSAFRTRKTSIHPISPVQPPKKKSSPTYQPLQHPKHNNSPPPPPFPPPPPPPHTHHTGSENGACTLLVPMDRVTTSRTIYRHERFEDPEAKTIKWRPVGKAPKETDLHVQPYHRVKAEQALLALFSQLSEVRRGVWGGGGGGGG